MLLREQPIVTLMMDLKRAEERADGDDVEKKLWRFEKVLEDERMKYGKDSNNF